MSNIIIYLKDGTKKEFNHEGRPGGSYTKTVYYRDGFAVVRDEWGGEIAYPAQDIDHVETTPNRGGF